MKTENGIFGAAAAVRESRGIALEEIAQLTKINLNYLRAIERGDFDVLPGGIYDVSYIRQYAEAIDFDEHQLLRAYGYVRPDAMPDRPQNVASQGMRPALTAALKRLGEFLSGAPAR